MIDVLQETALSQPDEAAIAALLEQCFPTEYGGRSFFQQRPHLRVIWRGPEIKAHMAVFLRAIRLGDALVDVIGIGDVATAPAHRGAGIATALMARALTVAPRAQFALLFGRHPLYSRAGFTTVPNDYRHVDMTGAWTGQTHLRPSQFLMVKALSDRPWPEGCTVDFLGALP